jgi:hypothetical protein
VSIYHLTERVDYIAEVMKEQKHLRRNAGVFASWIYLVLDGEGVFEFFHAGFEVLDFAVLLGEEDILNPPQLGLDGIESFVVVGKPFADHQSQFLKGDFPTVFQLFKMSGLHSVVASFRFIYRLLYLFNHRECIRFVVC